MSDTDKTRGQLLVELEELRRHVAELKRFETDRKRAEEAAKLADVQLDQIFETAADGMCVIDRDFSVIRVNEAFSALCGLSKDEAEGKKCHEVFAGPLCHTPSCALTRILGGEERVECDVEKERNDGTRIPCILTGTPFRGPGGELIGIVEDLKEITERKRAEEDVVKAKQLYENLVGNAGDAILSTTAEGVVTSWNRGAERLYGFTEDEALGKDVRDLIAPEDRPEEVTHLINRAAAGQAAVRAEIVRLRKDRSLAEVEVTNSPIRDSHGNVIGVSGIHKDISERKRAEEEAKRTVEKLRKALGGTIRAIALTVESRDPYTAGHQKRTTNLARAIANEMGLSKEQIDAIRMAGVVHDLGKIAVPAELLSKPTRLSEIEFALIKSHAEVGHTILKAIEFPWPIEQIVAQHHERMDGSGYPSGLSGEEITIEARVLAVADVVEAIISHRPYRPARGIDEALEEISRNRGIIYDPQVVDACVGLFTEKGFSFGY